MHAALLRQLPCCSVPRSLTSLSASTSSSATVCTSLGARHQHRSSTSRRHHQQQRHIARITNKRDEYELEGITDPEDIWGEDADQDFLEVDTVPMWSPEKGPAGPDRIFREAEDEQGIKQISIEDTAYWFSDLGGMDMPRTQMIRAIDDYDAEMIDEQLPCAEIEGCEPRLKLSDLEEGDELVGIITDIWLFHGALVDCLAEFKGLVPIRQLEWEDVHDMLMPGTQVVVKVHKISEYPKYRFPIHLELIEPAAAAELIMKPDEYKVPANVGWCFDQGWDIQEVAKQLDRPYEDMVALWEPDHTDMTDNIQYHMGFDGMDAHPYPGDWISREVFEEEGMMEEVQKSAVAESMRAAEEMAAAAAAAGGGGGGSGWGI